MDKVTGQCPQTTAFLKRKESRSGIEPRSFRLPAYRLTARPNRLSSTQPLSSELVFRAGPFNATEIMCDESGYSKEKKKKEKKKKEDRDNADCRRRVTKYKCCWQGREDKKVRSLGMPFPALISLNMVSVDVKHHERRKACIERGEHLRNCFDMLVVRCLLAKLGHVIKDDGEGHSPRNRFRPTCLH